MKSDNEKMSITEMMPFIDKAPNTGKMPVTEVMPIAERMSACSDAEGFLPPCAPLAVPYVPFQQTGSKRYSQREALNNGTLFPSLNLPFHINAIASDVGSGHLAELQALEFVLVELAMYLDTHQGDSEAFGLYKQYVALEKEARSRFEAIYGPLTHQSVANEKSWSSWLKDPWPWNYHGKKEA